jgi:hypothetical protein
VDGDALWTAAANTAQTTTAGADARLTTALEQPRAIRTVNSTGAVVHTAAQALSPPTEAFGLFSGSGSPASYVLGTARRLAARYGGFGFEV